MVYLHGRPAIIEVWLLRAAIIGGCIVHNIPVKLLTKQRGTPIITPADNGHNRAADTISGTTICVNISLKTKRRSVYARVDSFGVGLKKQLCVQEPPHREQRLGLQVLGFLPKRKDSDGMECCLVIVVQRRGSLLLH